MSRRHAVSLLALLVAAPLAAQGFGPMTSAPRELLPQFDANRNGRLDVAERRAALAWLASQPQGGRGMMGGGRGGGGATASPGARVTPKEVKSAGKAPFYADSVIRTVFLEFEDADWEAQLAAFYNSDVELPATVTIDGRRMRDVGVHFRGASSFFTVAAGMKRSLNLSLDWQVKDQAVQGYRTLNLLNSHEDPSFLRSVLFYDLSRHYLPALKANFVRVVINGESWGLYVSMQQFNKDFVRDAFGTTEGARWKVPGSPGARGGLEYLGDSIAPYRRHYEIKSKDDSASWRALVELTRVLNTTPADRLEAALAPILDVEGALRFLAMEVALVNNDGYWTRASDYSLYRDPQGRFHVLAHDANETFSEGRGGGGRGGPPAGGMPPGGPPPGGGAGGRRGGGPGGMTMGNAELDPLVGLTDATKPLRAKLLAVPALRARYLAHVRDIATTWLDWERLGPIVARYDRLIRPEVLADTKKLASDSAYVEALSGLQRFAERRRAFLLGWQPPS